MRKARETLERAIKMVNETERWNSRVVYGDTDRWVILLIRTYCVTSYSTLSGSLVYFVI